MPGREFYYIVPYDRRSRLVYSGIGAAFPQEVFERRLCSGVWNLANADSSFIHISWICMVHRRLSVRFQNLWQLPVTQKSRCGLLPFRAVHLRVCGDRDLVHTTVPRRLHLVLCDVPGPNVRQVSNEETQEFTRRYRWELETPHQAVSLSSGLCPNVCSAKQEHAYGLHKNVYSSVHLSLLWGHSLNKWCFLKPCQCTLNMCFLIKQEQWLFGNRSEIIYLVSNTTRL